MTSTLVIEGTPRTCEQICDRLNKYFTTFKRVTGTGNGRINKRYHGKEFNICNFSCGLEIKYIIELFWLKWEAHKNKVSHLKRGMY